MDVRARHAGVQHVAHDGHGEVAQSFFGWWRMVYMSSRPCVGLRVAAVTG